MFKLNRHGDDTAPLSHQHGRLHKGDSSVQETQETQVATLTDSSDLVVNSQAAEQSGVIKLSNVEKGARVNLSVSNSGLTGNEIGELLTPAADALETVSQDFASAKSAAAALTSTVRDGLDGVTTFFGDAVGKVTEVAKDPGTQLVAAGLAVWWLTQRKTKRA